MGLRIWNSLSDPYDSSQLAENWARVDEHDHTSGKGAIITTAAIADGAITAAKIASGAIPPPPQIANINSTQILDGAITGSKIASGAISIDKTQPILSASLSRTATTGSTSTFNKVTFLTTDFTSGAMTNIGTAPTRITVVTSGVYCLTGQVLWAAGTAGYSHSAQILKNGATVVAQTTAPMHQNYTSTTAPSDNPSIVTRLTAGDYIELQTLYDYYYPISYSFASLQAAMIGL